MSRAVQHEGRPHDGWAGLTRVMDSRLRRHDGLGKQWKREGLKPSPTKNRGPRLSGQASLAASGMKGEHEVRPYDGYQREA